MTLRYIDAHCHVQFEQYDEDREELIERMRNEGVAGVVVGCDLESSRKAVELAEKYEHLYAAVGIHPHDAPVGHDMSHLPELHALASLSRVIGVGECGLDYFRLTENSDAVKEAQKELFKQHIHLAAELDKPLIIHARSTKGTQDAYQDVLEILRDAKQKHPSLRGVAHFFAGGVAEAHAFVDLGFLVSFTAVITFARDYDDAIRAVPPASILAETDAPFVASASRRGQRNDPIAVVEVVAKLAEIRGEDVETVREATVANARSLFGV